MKVDYEHRYVMDTERITCTCPDFIHRRSHLAVNDEDRLCKHLRSIYTQLTPKLNDDGKTRVHRDVASMFLELVIPIIENEPLIKRYQVCGSYRRDQLYVSDLDILLVADGDLTQFRDNISKELNAETLWSGDINTSYKVGETFQIDFKTVPEESFPFSTLHYTGSKKNNIMLRKVAKNMGLSLSEYGFRVVSTDEFIDLSLFKCEEDIFEYLDVKYKKPNER